MLGEKETIKLQCDPTLGNFIIYLEYSTIDCNNKVRIIKQSNLIPHDKLCNFNDYYETLKSWMDNEIKTYFFLYKEEMGYKNDYKRLENLKLENCIHRETNGKDEYIRSYILSDFKRAMLYLQALTAEGLFYLDEYKKYIFKEFRDERQFIYQKYEMTKTLITANEPTARYDHYSRWLISYQKTLDNMAREKEIESKVENLDKLLEEVNNHD